MVTNRWYALIPAYEPSYLLPTLAGALTQAGFSVVVVDDGSGPLYHTVFELTKRSATVLSCPANNGKGHALRLGLAHLRALCGSSAAEAVIVTLDADGQHTVDDAWRVAAQATRHPGELVLGVRSFGTGTPLRSRLGNGFSSLLYRAVSGQQLGDTQTGLRGFTADLLPLLLGVPGERYEYEMNVLLECPRQGVELRQVPIQTIYLEGNKSSHFNTLRDSARIFRSVLPFAASSLLAFGLDYGLYSLLVALLGGVAAALALPVANIAARLVSASVNFAVNRRFVFKSKVGATVSAVQYFVLAGCILCGNTLLLSALVEGLGVNPYAAKLVTELTFFIFSWLGQRFWIFKERTATLPAKPAQE